MARNFIILAFLLLLVCPGSAFSEENAPSGTAKDTGTGKDEVVLAQGNNYSEEQLKAAEETSVNTAERWWMRDFIPAQHFTLEPEAYLAAGYRFTGVTGSRRAAEFDYLHSSPTAELGIHYYPLPVRVDIDFDIKNERDHYAEVGIGYSDILKLDLRSTELFHNLDHYMFLNTGSVAETIPDKQFGITVSDNDLRLVLKVPGWPMHIYAEARTQTKEGTIQQRWTFNGFGAGKSSDPRDIDWLTQELTAGINGNVLGWFEADYHFTIKTFESDLRQILLPPPGAFSHNLTPDFETHEHVFSLHSNQSWPFSVAATASFGDKTNEFSRAKVGFDRYYGDISYRPTDNMMVAVKYGHQNLNVTNPEDVPAAPSPPAGGNVDNKSISTRRDRGVASVNYYPIPSLMVLAQYKVDYVSKTNAKTYDDPDGLNLTKASTVTHTGKVGFTFTPERHTKIRAGFSYAHSGDPERNVDYTNKYEGYVWGTWVPTPGLVVDANYKMLRGNNPVRNEMTDAQFMDQRDRHVEKDTAGAGVNWFAMRGLVLGARYEYMRLKMLQNLVYENTGGNFVYDFGSPYWDTSHNYNIYANYCFETVPLSVNAEFGQTWTRGLYLLDDTLTGPIAPNLTTNGLASFTNQQIRDTYCKVRADWTIWRGWGTSFSYGFSQFRDMVPFDLVARNGTAHYGTVLLTKKF